MTNIRVGSTGDNVRKIQTLLKLRADGDFGPATERAVREYQTTHKLPVTGIVGPQTWAHMFPGELIKEDVVIPAVPHLRLDRLKGHIPESVLNQIPEASIKFNITTPLRLAHFLAQCSHESGNFRLLEENLNYDAAGLRKIFSRHFPGTLSESYSRNPQRIANRAYANRMGNGDETSGDGWRFRGRGYIQLTGRHNYTEFAKFIGEDVVSNPDLVATKYPLASAAYFFNSNKLWSVCDRGSDDAAVTAVSRRVNGGTIGLQHRISEFKRFYNLLK
jgi:putative chitinase